MTTPSEVPASVTLAVFVDVIQERVAQTKKWGVQRHDFSVWITVLAEEMGELSRAVLLYREQMTDQRLVAMKCEAVQVAALAIAMIEHIDEVRE